ncbi:MAG: LLM class flavin-dependent oxidoreductase [Chloroflexi bacterium]|nr:LLM class flavin-dependent oxidoreductase [Chloroflexota bacterium]
MRYGFVLPGGTATQQLDQAIIADQAGWDGIFVWEAAYGEDPWALLSAMAMRTSHVRLGTLLTPLPWRRPWKLACQVATLDQLSGGRAILALGLGAVDPALGSVGEETDRKVRAERLDEGIDLIAGLWAGDLTYSGKHYNVDLAVRQDMAGLVLPVQKPRPPIWVVADWPRPKSMRRALRWDGILPMCLTETEWRETEPRDIGEMLRWLDEQGGVRPGFDVIMEGETPADDPAAAAAQVTPWAEAGCTWWLETRWSTPHHSEERAAQVIQRLRAGPPR